MQGSGLGRRSLKSMGSGDPRNAWGHILVRFQLAISFNEARRACGRNAEPAKELYLPTAQVPWLSATLLLRSDANSQPLAASTKKLPDGPHTSHFGNSQHERCHCEFGSSTRLIAQFIGVYGIRAVAVAIRMYGVTAYSLTPRKRELGIRIALGCYAAGSKRGPSRLVTMFQAQTR